MNVTSASPPAQPAQILGEGIWGRATALMRAQPAWLILLPLAFVALGVGWLDYSTGWELSLFIFYAVPILMAVWWAGTPVGVVMAIACGCVWWVANGQSNPYETTLGYTWAMLSRLFYFFIVVIAVTAVRRRQDADAARIRMLEDHRQLEQDIVAVSDYEQQRIGQDIHDGLCQMLAAIGCATRILSDDLKARGLPEAGDADLIEESLQRTTLEARNLARGIFPVHIDRTGLAAALAELASITSQLTGVAITFEATSDIDLDDPKAAMHLYRIAQEAVANSVRHGESSRVAIQLDKDSDALTLSVRDNGKGLKQPFHRNHKGMGLRVMRYRARCVDGDIRIGVPAAGGTEVVCNMPLSRPIEESHDHH